MYFRVSPECTFMPTIYISRNFDPVTIDAVNPGDAHVDLVRGECRRLTPRRFVLAGERLGIGSEAFLRLVEAIGNSTSNSVYDGRSLESWYGLVGLDYVARKDELTRTVCPKCKCFHNVLEEHGRLWNDGICVDCWSKEFIPAEALL